MATSHNTAIECEGRAQHGGKTICDGYNSYRNTESGRKDYQVWYFIWIEIA